MYAISSKVIFGPHQVISVRSSLLLFSLLTLTSLLLLQPLPRHSFDPIFHIVRKPRLERLIVGGGIEWIVVVFGSAGVSSDVAYSEFRRLCRCRRFFVFVELLPIVVAVMIIIAVVVVVVITIFG